MIRVKVRPVMILAKAVSCRVYCSTCVVVFTAEATAVAAATMAKAASNISKVTEAAYNAPEHPGDPVHASSAGSLAIGPRTVKITLQRVRPPPRHNRSRW
jgi:hypothetical protein